MNYPYDDDIMTYDYTYHRYVLTPEAAIAKLGTDLSTYLDSTGDANPSTLPDRILNGISAHLYAWIYSNNPANQKFVEYLLAKDPECRPIIQECLINELKYALKNGDFYDYADNEHGFDKEVSPTTRWTLAVPLSNGHNLLYRGWVPWISADVYRKGY